MVGFEILVTIPRDKRQEFLQTCELLSDQAGSDAACTRRALYENVMESNQFIWVEHWEDVAQMDARLRSDRFGVLLGAIEVLGVSNRLLRFEATDSQIEKKTSMYRP